MKHVVRISLFLVTLLCVQCGFSGCGGGNASISPQQANASVSPQQTKDATLIANLQEVRAALAQFHSDTGAYPNGLSDLVDPKTNPPYTGMDGVDFNTIIIPSGSYKGPYFPAQGGIANSGIPLNPYANTSAMTPPCNGSDIAQCWTYSNGTVHPAVPVTGNDQDGVPYQSL